MDKDEIARLANSLFNVCGILDEDEEVAAALAYFPPEEELNKKGVETIAEARAKDEQESVDPDQFFSLAYDDEQESVDPDQFFRLAYDDKPEVQYYSIRERPSSPSDKSSDSKRQQNERTSSPLIEAQQPEATAESFINPCSMSADDEQKETNSRAVLGKKRCRSPSDENSDAENQQHQKVRSIHSLTKNIRKITLWESREPFCPSPAVLALLPSNATYSIRPVRGDGDCLFNSIALALRDQYGQHVSAAQLRTEAVNFIESNREHYAAYLLDNVDMGQYLLNMRQSGAWADHLVIDAVARRLNIQIQIIDTAAGFESQPVSTFVLEDQNANRPLVVLHRSGNENLEHYDPILPVPQAPTDDFDMQP